MQSQFLAHLISARKSIARARARVCAYKCLDANVEPDATDPVLARPPAGNPAGSGEPAGEAQEFRCELASAVRNGVPKSGFATVGGAFVSPQRAQHITPSTTSPANPYQNCWCGSHSRASRAPSCVCACRGAFSFLNATPQAKYKKIAPPRAAANNHPALSNASHCGGALSVPDVHPCSFISFCGLLSHSVHACGCAAFAS